MKSYPDLFLVEYITGSPYVDDLKRGGWKLDADGMLPIPASPGLGIDLDMEAVARYTRGGSWPAA